MKSTVAITTISMLASLPAHSAERAKWVSSARSGPWSVESTWDDGALPAAGDRVHIRPGHTVTYDVISDRAIRAIYVAGTLKFDPDKDTRLDVGVIKIEAGDEPSEDGFDCDAHLEAIEPQSLRPALEVGASDAPISAAHRALIRLVAVSGQDPGSCPAIVACGGRMDFHGAPMNRTWVKLGATANQGNREVTLAEPVIGWRVGDRVIITATKLGRALDNGDYQTEERKIAAIAGLKLTLDAPLVHEHLGVGDFRGEIANLSRNVVVESADPSGTRGHTMYHRGSQGSISYAEFRHLGKRDLLGRYSLHFHLVGSTMRGSSVVGASIWDSHNRWLTIHGTNYLVVRDCVGYRSVGHGFFFEDGTEVLNVLDRNLAVQALGGKPLAKQVLPFDNNDGAGYWWANSHNTFTRNVSCENNRYGYRFEALESSVFKLTLPVQQADGDEKAVDIRTLPFVRFDDNEAHCDGLYGINLGEGVNRIGPDERHPFVMRNTKIWEIHYALRPQSPCLLIENMQLHHAVYGVYHPNYDRHVYRNVTISHSPTSGDAEPFNRGHDDDSVQFGSLTVDGLTFSGQRASGMPLVQITDDNPTGKAETHLRHVQVIDWLDEQPRALVNLGGGPRPTPKTPTSVPVFVHDYFGTGRHAKVLSTRSGEFASASRDEYRSYASLTGDESRAREIRDIDFPQLLNPVDDEPPASVITSVRRIGDKVRIRGVTSDSGEIREVLVNGEPARATRENFAEWESTLPESVARDSVTAVAVDRASNVEQLPHCVFMDGLKEEDQP